MKEEIFVLLKIDGNGKRKKENRSEYEWKQTDLKTKRERNVCSAE